MIARAVAIAAIQCFVESAVAQCPEPDSSEYLSTIRSRTIKYEVMSFIPWVWEYEGKGERPALVEVAPVMHGDHDVRFNGQGVVARISEQPFDSTTNKVDYLYQDRYRVVCSINGRHFRGTDGGVPTRRISKVSVSIDGQQIAIPRRAWDDLYQPNLCSTNAKGVQRCSCNVVRSVDRTRVYVHMSNSDGAGGYHVIWIFINGRYVRRVIEGPP